MASHEINKCEECLKTFSKKSNLNKHLKTVHNKLGPTYGKYERSFQCLDGCEISFRYNKDLLQHLTDNHEFEMEVEEKNFSNFEEFEHFLNQLHSLNNIQYVQQTGKKSTTGLGEDGKFNSEIIYFNCNRSGKYIQMSSCKRRTKLRGSSKLNRSCTSKIKVIINKENSSVKAIYFKSHYGHDFDLQHLRIPKIEKANIAHKLASGINFSRIINDNRDNFNSEELNRIHLLTRMDIQNVKKQFNLEIQEGVRHCEDAVSVDMYVQECSNMANNPIIFYKPQGVEDENNILGRDDFCLVIMNKSQEEMLCRFGDNIVAIDSTHGINSYDFELTTILIIDEWGEGFPGVCMLTNRKDSLIFQLLFRKVKDKVGILNSKVFMSDITNVFYNAWKIEMGEVPSQLYCSWHIDRAWQSNLNKISNTETKKSVYQVLKILQTTICKDEFHKLLEKTIIELCDSDITKHFGLYFKNHYSLNYKTWAYSYRLNSGINTNMRLESMHKILKYMYLDGKKVKRLDKGLHALNQFIRDKVVERVIKRIKGKNTYHLKNINTRHSTSLKVKYIIKIFQETDNSSILRWSVSTSSETDSHSYIVSKSNTDNICCPLVCSQCHICIHSYSCTCPDFFIHNTICKHIHSVAHSNKSPIINHVHQDNNHKLNSEDVADLKSNLETLKDSTNNFTQNINTLQKTISNENTKLQNYLATDPSSSNVLTYIAKSLKTANNFIQTSLNTAITQSKINFKPQYKIEANSKISKQLRFFSTKKKRIIKNNRITKPNDKEIKSIKNLLGNYELFISNDPLLDHNYC